MNPRQILAMAWLGALLEPGRAVDAQALPISFGQAQTVGQAEELGSVMDAALGPDGSVYVVDFSNSRVVAFSPGGERRWSFGRRGRGPGEFQMPYRVDVRRDGTVFVYDAGVGEVTTISPEGRMLQRYRLPFPLTQADNLVALDDLLLFSGTTADPTGSTGAIHRFQMDGPELKYAGSFGAVPVTRDPRVLQQWGAGALVRGSTGSIWYTRRVPYEVYRFTPSGRQRAVIRPPFRTRGTPDDAIRVEGGARRVTYTATDAIVETPGPAWELPGGVLLVTRVRGDEQFWDVFTVSGRYLGAHPVPDHWEIIAGYDATRGVLWVTGTQNDNTVLYRVPVTLSTPHTRRR
jgi:hypothetical protein